MVNIFRVAGMVWKINVFTIVYKAPSEINLDYHLLNWCRMQRTFSVIGLVLVLALTAATGAQATVTNTLPSGVLVSPDTYTAVRSSNSSNTDVGNQSPANVESVLESAAWFNQPLTFVGGGSCLLPASDCTTFDNGSNAKGGSSTLVADVYGVHYGNNFIAVLYSDLQSGFGISGLGHGVSNIYAFNTVSQVPLPAALPLFFSALTMLGLGGWVRRRRATA